MADNYSQSVVRLVIVQICKSVGWDSINSSALEVLIDLVERHISQIGRRSRRYGEQFGRVDPTIDDLEMVFRDAGINLKEMFDYTKNVEPLSLAQPVLQYPVEPEAKVDLLIPEIDEEGKIMTPAAVLMSIIKPEATVKRTSSVDNLESSSKPTIHTSPIKTAQRNSRLAEGLENTKFRMRSQLVTEDGELSSMFAKGKAPRVGRPPRPLHETNIPKLRVEPTSKPKIKTGILKPKPKVPIIVDEPEIKEEIPVTVEANNEEEQTTPEKKREKHKPPKKVENKKKRKKAAANTQPEGFTDIFGAPLEKPPAKSKSKPVKLEKSSSGKGLVVSPSRVSSSASQHKDDVKSDSDVSARAVTPESVVDESNPTVKARLSNWDDTIDSVLAKSTAAQEAFSFDDRPMTPVEQLKASLKSPSKKSKSPGRSSKRATDTISAVSKGRDTSPVEPEDRVESKPEISPTGNKSGKSKKDKKKKSRREQLLERFAAAPITSFPSEEPSTPKSTSNDQASTPPPQQSDLSRDNSVSEPEPSIVSETVQSATFNVEEDDEAELVNVDEDSDVDILEASSPTPPPQNPYSAYASTGYTESGGPPTPPFHQPQTESLQPLAYEQPLSRLSGEPEDPQWKGYPPEQPQSAEHWDQWGTANSLTIDFGATPHSDTEVVKKGKHKKEKKEKKEKKKKKHKEKDKDRDKERRHEESGDHTRKHISPQAEEPEEEVNEETVPRLTLKLGAQAMQADSGPSDLDTSYNTAEELLSPELVPRLVIKPIRIDADDSHDQSAYPETAGFAPEVTQQPFPVTTDCSNEPPPVPDEDGKIWICPTCTKPDDGSPMIGCDSCDEWYHWPCVGIVTQPPDDMEWFCPTCAKNKKKKKKRKKEKH